MFRSKCIDIILRPGMRGAALAFCLGLSFAAAGTVRADSIDEGLIRHAPKVMKYLHDSGYDNVGVLSFRVKKPNEEPTFKGGLMSHNMADRLENSLVLALSPEAKPVGIIRNASEVAVKNLDHASYRKQDERKQLFDLEYPLAWGTEPTQVKPDVLLTGKVTLSDDLKDTTVSIEAFDSKNPGKFTKLLDFTVKTDRYILSDLGQGFSLSRSLAKGKQQFRRGAPETDDDLIIFDEFEDMALGKESGSPGKAAASKTDLPKKDDSVSFDDFEDLSLVKPVPVQKTVEPAKPTQPTTSSNTGARPPTAKSSNPGEFPVELKIYYNGKEQRLEPDSAHGTDNLRIPDPKEGERVTFGLRNKTNERIGVVLTVNGISTLYEEVGQPNQVTKWVLEPNKEYLVKGYHEDNNKFTNIEGLPEQLTKEKFSDFGIEAGQIHLSVFRPSVSGGTSAPGFSRSMRAVSPKVLSKDPPKTPFELQAIIARNANAQGGRGLMAWGLGGGAEQLEPVKLDNVGMSDTMVITYYSKK